jgi:hypothetical protein
MYMKKSCLSGFLEHILNIIQRQLIPAVRKKTSEESAATQDEEPGSNQAEDPLSFDEEPPSIERTPRPALWADVPDEKWDNWHWQLANRLNSLDELAQIINLTPE